MTKRLVLLLIALLLCSAGDGRRVSTPTDVDQLISQQSPTFDFDASTAVVEQGPANCYRLNDNAASTTVVNKCGGAAGTASADTSTFCNTAAKVGTGCTFVIATSHYIDLGSDIIGTGDDSVCMWVAPTDATMVTDQRFIDNGSFEFAIIANTGTIGLTCDNSTWVVSTGTLSDGVLTHVCVVRKAAGTATFYINGVQDGAADQSCGVPAAGSGNALLGNNAASSRDYGGVMDDVRHYPFLLTPAQIQALAQTPHESLAANKNSTALVLDATGAVAALQSKGVELYQSVADNRPTLVKSGSRRWLHFDGVNDSLASGSAISTLFVDHGKTWALVAYPDAIDAAKVLFGETGDKFQLSTNTTGSGVWKALSDATSVEVAGTTAPTVLTGTHDGTAMKLRANGTESYFAAVNTSAITGTIELGTDGATYWAGLVGRVSTWNKVLPTSVLLPIEQGLAKRFGSSTAATAEVSCDNFIRSLTPTLWLRAGDGSTITQAAGLVSSWCSRVGSVCFTQTTDANKPTWTGAGVVFDQSRPDYLTSTSALSTVIANNAATLVAVWSDTDATAAFPAVFSSSDLAIMFRRDKGSTRMQLYHDDGAADSIYSAVGSFNSGVTVIADATHDTNLNLSVQGTASGAVASGNTTALTGTLLISSSNAANKVNGTVKELILDNAVWTADQRARVRSCLGQMYGVAF